MDTKDSTLARRLVSVPDHETLTEAARLGPEELSMRRFSIGLTCRQMPTDQPLPHRARFETFSCRLINFSPIEKYRPRGPIAEATFEIMDRQVAVNDLSDVFTVVIFDYENPVDGYVVP